MWKRFRMYAVTFVRKVTCGIVLFASAFVLHRVALPELYHPLNAWLLHGGPAMPVVTPGISAILALSAFFGAAHSFGKVHQPSV